MTSPDASGEMSLTSEQITELALSTIRAVIGTDRYQYLSGPITGGRRLLDWHFSQGFLLEADAYRAARETAVVIPNIADVKKTAALEREAGRLTIEPGSFEANFPHWGQPEFLRFWARVIEDHARSVRFLDGWQFSAGCVFEYRCALKEGHPTQILSGEMLSLDDMCEQVDQALADIRARGDLADPANQPVARLFNELRGHRDEIAAGD